MTHPADRLIHEHQLGADRLLDDPVRNHSPPNLRSTEGNPFPATLTLSGEGRSFRPFEPATKGSGERGWFTESLLKHDSRRPGREGKLAHTADLDTRE